MMNSNGDAPANSDEQDEPIGHKVASHRLGDSAAHVLARVGPKYSSYHQVAKRDLNRYVQLLERARPTGREAVMTALTSVYDDVEISDFVLAARAMEAEIEDAPARMFEGDVTREEVLGVVEEWTLLERAAALDGIERFLQGDGASLEEVGLVVPSYT